MSRADFGPNGQAQRVRPCEIIETINAGVHQRVMQDCHMVDRLRAAKVLTSGQYEAAVRVLDLFDESGLEGRVTASYAPLGGGPGHPDDQPEHNAITRFRLLLVHMTAPEAMALHAMVLGDPPGERGLTCLRRVLDRLADRWGF